MSNSTSIMEMEDQNHEPVWFYVCAFTSSLLLAAQSVTWFRKRRRNRIFRQTHSCVKWLRIAHYAMCVSFVTSTMTLAALKITCVRRHEFYQPLIEILLQMLMVLEIQSIVAETICNMHLHQNLSKLSKLVLCSSVVVLAAPIVASLFSSVLELTLQSEGNLHHDNIAANTGMFLNDNTSQTQTASTIEHTTATESLTPVATTATQRHPSDPLLALQPIFFTQAGAEGKISPETWRPSPEVERQLGVIANETGTTVGLYERLLLIKYLQEVEAGRSEMLCWMTWPAQGLLVTYVVVTLSCCYGYAMAAKEYARLRKAAKAKAVPLESWLATVVRPTLITVTLLKWLAVSLEFHSPQCLYTVGVAIILAPFLYPFVVGPKRCSRTGEMRRGFLSKRFEKLNFGRAAACCRRRNIGSYSIGINVGYERTSHLESSQSVAMLQLEETRGHVGGDVMMNQTLRDFVRERFDTPARDVTKEINVYDADSSVFAGDDVKQSANDSEDEGYGVTRPRDYDVVDVAADLAKCKLAGGRGSVFDDSDYDEVMDFLTSPTSSTCEEKVDERAAIPEVSVTPDDAGADNSSKRSSGASQVESVASSGTLSSSGVESSDEKPNPKYASLDIAKILHTRKRIQRILHTPQQDETNDAHEEETPVTNTASTKKKSVYKRHTHYGTLGRRSKSSSKRASSISRPLSGGENEYPESATYQPGDYATFDPLRARRDVRGGAQAGAENYFTFDRPKSRESDSDGNSDTNRSSGAFEGGSKRWSRLSTNSQNSDKASISPQKGPFKAFRRFVYSTSSSNVNSTAQPLSHEEKKAMIQVCVSEANSNNNNSICHPDAEEIISRGEYALRKDEKNKSYSCIPAGVVDAASEYTYSPTVESSPRRESHTLLRRLSKKSSPARGRDPRRSSLPSQSMYDVRSVSQPPANDVTPPKFRYGDGSQQRGDIESRVMASVERNDKNSKSEGKSLQKTNSLKRLFSFAKKRPSVKKSPVKRSETAPPASMNKTLSYSSPQLSVFSVNSTGAGSGSGRAGLAQKLVF